MISFFQQLFSYTFFVRCIVVGALVSLCAALLGVSLVLKRYSMIGDGLSHVGFGALSVAAVMNVAPLAVAIPVVVAAAFVLLWLNEKSMIKGDAAIAIFSTVSLALGVIILSQSGGLNIDVNNYMFGSILAIDSKDVGYSVALSICVIFLFVIFYNRIFAVTFDETFSKVSGVNTGIYNILIALLTALTIVIGMRIMGTLLISSLVIFPALSSMRVCKRFLSVVICSAIISVVCFFIGIVVSYIYSTPAGASVVIVNAFVFALFSLVGKIKRHGKV